MLIKDHLTKLLISRKFDEIMHLITKNPRAKHKLFSFIYYKDQKIKWHTVTAIGMLAEKTENVQEIMRRFFWALNDESGAVPFGVPESIGEILFKRPDLQKEYICILMSHLYNKDQFQTGLIKYGLIWAAGRIGKGCASFSSKILPVFLQTMKENNYLARATSVWAIGEIGLADGQKALENMSDDKESDLFYDRDKLIEKSVADLVCQSLKRIKTD